MAHATTPSKESTPPAFEAPHPGSRQMPHWNTGELIEPPRFTSRNWFAMLGPGLVAGGAAIGGGEWLIGPQVTAMYGGALLWLATLSIVAQLIYNIEISRYTLYTGEPIFTGKFRTLPGPVFWIGVYLVLDFGAVFPYLAASAATPLAAVILGELPNPTQRPSDAVLLRGLSYFIFLLALVPLIFGGKIYNALKALMAFKIVFVMGFLFIIGVLYSQPGTWKEIFSGFFRFGTVPVVASDGQLSGSADVDAAAVENATAALRPGKTENVFLCLIEGRDFPVLDLSLIASLAALAAIAGQGGLTNTPISNYTRDQGWGMGWHVGAIPSLVGGRNIKLSHVGMVFQVTRDSLKRWRGWYRHVARDQLVVWFPACFLGLALPSMLSVEFLPRGTQADDWTIAGMTADGVRDRVATETGAGWGSLVWYLTLFSGFLVLGPSMASTADGLVRRWVDAFWTASPRLRTWDPKDIKKLYFGVLFGWTVFSLIMLSVAKPLQLLHYATMLMNYALGFSCWHTLAVNMILLPKELRPGWFPRIGLVLSGLFFTVMALITTLDKLGWM